MKRHRWYASKHMQGFFCSDCNRHSHEREASECLVAVHPDPAINKLYRARRKAATAADGSGYKASRGWAELEQIQTQLRELDPEGDWRLEGNYYDGLGWRVKRPEGEATDPARREVEPSRPTGSAGTDPTDATQRRAYMARKTATPSTASTKTAAAPKAEAVQFQPLLIAALKAEGVKPEVRVAPKGNYSSLLLDGTNIAYLDKQTSKGMKVIAAGKPGELKNGFVASGRSGKFAAQLLVSKEAEVAKAAAGLKLVAEALAAATRPAPKAKAEPKPKPAPKAKAEQADGPAVTPNAVVVREGSEPEAVQAEVQA
jgi:hypothetical protein